jgi:two-component system, sensor histidine kinase and response regulator
MRVNISTLAPLLGKQPRVLLVAETPALQAAFGTAFLVEHVADQAAALASVEATLPDAVVAVHRPPGCDVLELCTTVKRAVESRVLPVVGIAGGGPPVLELDAIQAGVDHWFAAEPDPQLLRARLAALVQGWGMYRAVEGKARSLMLLHDWVRYLVHDLRTPLGIAVGNVSLALERVDRRPAAPMSDIGRSLADAARALGSATAMINDLLDGDRLRHGALSLKRDAIKLGAVARDAAEALTAEALRRGRPLRLVESGDTTVDGDPGLLRRVCANLIENALRHGSGGEVEVMIEGSMMEVIVRVANQGPTISEALREGLFDPWTNLNSETFSLRTGLGLSFSRIVVEAHGGRIWLESPPDGRVVFAWAVPRAVAE